MNSGKDTGKEVAPENPLVKSRGFHTVAVCSPCATIFFPWSETCFCSMKLEGEETPEEAQEVSCQTWRKQGMNTTLGSLLQTVKIPDLAGTVEEGD